MATLRQLKLQVKLVDQSLIRNKIKLQRIKTIFKEKKSYQYITFFGLITICAIPIILFHRHQPESHPQPKIGPFLKRTTIELITAMFLNAFSDILTLGLSTFFPMIKLNTHSSK